MPISVTFDEDLNAWRWSLAPPLEIDEIQRVVDEVRRAPGGRAGADALWDVREFPVGESPAEMVRSLAARLGPGSEVRRGARIAVVVERKVDFGVTRMYQAFAEDRPQTFQIFWSVVEAESWLQAREEEP